MDGDAIAHRCWCWRYGRCLTDCPTADHPPPRPLTDESWRRAYDELKQKEDHGR